MRRDFDEQLSDILEDYTSNLTQKLNSLTATTAKELKAELSRTAPVGKRKKNKLKNSFLVTTEKLAGMNIKATVHSSEYRLLHLVENGHLKRNGQGKTRASHFIAKATDKIIPEYETNVERAVRDND